MFFRLSRIRDWAHPILIPFVVSGYLLSRPDFFESYTNLIYMLIVSTLGLSFWYSINDFFDSEADKLKPHNRNVISLGLLGRKEAGLFSLVSFMG